MLKLVKDIDEQNMCHEVFAGTNTDWALDQGFEEKDVEKAWNGAWYLSGSCPEKPESIIKQERIAELKSYLNNADYWGQKYLDGEYTEDEWSEKKAQRKAWREEIRSLEDETSAASTDADSDSTADMVGVSDDSAAND